MKPQISFISIILNYVTHTIEHFTLYRSHFQQSIENTAYCFTNNDLRYLQPRNYYLCQCFSNCGAQWYVRWFTGAFGRKLFANIVSDTERMKNTPIHVCSKTAFVSLTTCIIFLLFTCMHFWVWGILWKNLWSMCTPTAYDVVRDSRKFEKHWSMPYIYQSIKITPAYLFLLLTINFVRDYGRKVSSLSL
jgi:hypothetical protein